MSITSTATFPPIAVLDEEGIIVEVNQAWRAFGSRNGLPEEYTAVRKDYVAIAQQSDGRYADRIVTELRSLLSTDQTEFAVVYPCHSPNQERWFRLYATVVSIGANRYYVLVHQRLNRNSSSKNDAPSDDLGSPSDNAEYRDRNRLVTYNLSVDESATDGILMAFDAIGIDVQSQDTTLQDWIHFDAINALQAGTSEFQITFLVWNYPVSLTPETVIIYTPEDSSR